MKGEASVLYSLYRPWFILYSWLGFHVAVTGDVVASATVQCSHNSLDFLTIWTSRVGGFLYGEFRVAGNKVLRPRDFWNMLAQLQEGSYRHTSVLKALRYPFCDRIYSLVIFKGPLFRIFMPHC